MRNFLLKKFGSFANAYYLCRRIHFVNGATKLLKKSETREY